MVGQISKNQKAKGLFFTLILGLVLCCSSDFWQQPAFCEKKKEIMLAPTEDGSAWNLPAGDYSEEEQEDSSGDTGESPIGPAGDSSGDTGGSPIGPSGGSSGDTGGSPIGPAGGSSGDKAGSPLPANQK